MSIAMQEKITGFQESMEPIPRPTIEEFIQQQQTASANHINYIYDVAVADIEQAYAIADYRLAKVIRKAGDRALELVNPQEYRRIKRARAASRARQILYSSYDV
jgi:hypothetical protein